MAQPNSNNTVKVASIQAPSVFKNTTANIQSFTILIKEAASAGAKIIVLPEAAITGYASQDFKHSWCIPIKSRIEKFDDNAFTPHDPLNYAQDKNGPIVQYFKKLCKQLKIYLTVPFIEKVKSVPRSNVYSNNGINVAALAHSFFEWYKYKYYNAISLIDPCGNVIAHYRKTNLWPYYDNPWATPGDKTVTAETEYGRVGLGVCYDIHKILPKYKNEGIWSLLYCIAWVDDPDFIWFSDDLPKILKKKDITYNIIGCNWSVPKYKINNINNNIDNDVDDVKSNDNNNCVNKTKIKYEWDGYGKTTLYGPRGKIIASTDNLYDSEIIYANIPYKPSTTTNINDQ